MQMSMCLKIKPQYSMKQKTILQSQEERFPPSPVVSGGVGRRGGAAGWRRGVPGPQQRLRCRHTRHANGPRMRGKRWAPTWVSL